MTDFPSSSVAFDWCMSLLGALLMGGIVQDGWAHAHGKVDQSFLTPWHAVLYSMMALNGVVLGATAIVNARRRASLRRTLPYGYGLALGGVFLFAAGGVADLAWHTLFGIETDLDALLSPSHLVLALASMLIFTGPLRSIGRRWNRETGGWRRIGPTVFSLLAAATLLGFFLDYAQPVEDGTTTTAIQRDPNGPEVASLYAIDADGTHETNLPLPDHQDAWGLVAPARGDAVAYRVQAPSQVQSSATRASNIVVARPDGSHARTITHTTDHATQPAWSADGTRIAYVVIPAGRSGNYSLHVVRPDGSGDRTIVDGVTTLGDPAWSPDGSTIAYESRQGLDAELATINVASGVVRWLPFTKDATYPVFIRNRIAYATGDGGIASSALDGSQTVTLVPPGSGASSSAVSPDGTRLAYLASGSGTTQLFVGRADGSHPLQATHLAGSSAERAAWIGPNRLIFTATPPEPPSHSGVASALAIAANLLQAIVLSGLLLAGVRRFRLPIGACTVMFGLFALAMATQSDAYYDVWPFLATGLLADVALTLSRDRVRAGVGFYAFAALVPALLTSGYLAATAIAGGTSWTPDMLLGTPLLCACAGLCIAFCFESPIPEAEPQS